MCLYYITQSCTFGLKIQEYRIDSPLCKEICIPEEVLLLRGDVAKVWVDAEAPCELDAQTLIAANFVAGSLRSVTWT